MDPAPYLASRPCASRCSAATRSARGRFAGALYHEQMAVVLPVDYLLAPVTTTGAARPPVLAGMCCSDAGHPARWQRVLPVGADVWTTTRWSSTCAAPAPPSASLTAPTSPPAAAPVADHRGRASHRSTTATPGCLRSGGDLTLTVDDDDPPTLATAHPPTHDLHPVIWAFAAVDGVNIHAPPPDAGVARVIGKRAERWSPAPTFSLLRPRPRWGASAGGRAARVLAGRA